MNQTQTYPEAPCLWCGETLRFAPRPDGPARGRVWQHADGAVVRLRSDDPTRDDHAATPVRS